MFVTSNKKNIASIKGEMMLYDNFTESLNGYLDFLMIRIDAKISNMMIIG